MLDPQTLFLADTKTKIKQYLYRNLENTFDPTIGFLQDASGIGCLNWFKQENAIRISRVFKATAEAALAYTMSDGDYRTYMLLQYVEIVYEEFKDELFRQYVMTSYNVTPESVVGNLDNVTAVAPPQTTNFPGLPNTSNEFNPTKRNLIAKELYD